MNINPPSSNANLNQIKLEFQFPLTNNLVHFGYFMPSFTVLNKRMVCWHRNYSFDWLKKSIFLIKLLPHTKEYDEEDDDNSIQTQNSGRIHVYWIDMSVLFKL